MSEALAVMPSTDDVQTGVQETEAIAEGLADVLADTYRLIFKTHAYHWNVTGPMFFSIHKLTDEQYENMFRAADVLAERIRALGQLAPHKFSDISQMSRIKDKDELPDAKGMIDDLVRDHEMLSHRLHALVELSGNNRDPVTEDLATARSAFHEEAAWMLRAIAST